MDENQKAMRKMRDLEEQLKSARVQNQNSEKELKEFKLKALKESKGLYIEENDDEVNIQANNMLGSSQSISLKQLQELRDTLKKL
jgi:hypothetical protein